MKLEWNKIRDRLSGGLKPKTSTATAAFALPRTLLEIQPEFVYGVKIDGTARRPRRLAVTELSSGVLRVHSGQSNISDHAELVRSLLAVTQSIGRNGYAGLILPDALVRVGILSFESLPEKPQETESLVRWKMQEQLPWSVDQARFSYQVQSRTGQEIEVLTTAARDAVLSEYERAVAEVCSGTALVLPATLALLPLLPADGAHLLVHVCSGWVTNAVIAGSRLRLWRTREFTSHDRVEAAREAAAEAARVLSSVKDRFQLQISNAWLCFRPSASPELHAELERALGQPAETLRHGAATRTTQIPELPMEDQHLFEQYAAPVAGLLANNGVAT